MSTATESPRTRFPVSTVVIACNEERNIERCLSSVAPFSREILVVDSHSTDRTVEIARDLGARVLIRDWAGYGPQKRFAVANASHPWVFSIDADEEASPELARELESLDFTADGYEVPRAVYYLGRWIRHGPWYPGYVLRLFRKDRGDFTEDRVHERVRIDGRVTRLKGELFHYSYRDVDHHLDKMNELTTLSAERMFGENRRAGVLRLAVQPPLEFVRAYVVRAGFLDGYPGLVIALLHAYYVFLKYAKLRELSLRTGRT